jgi:hypothetical protein
VPPESLKVIFNGLEAGIIILNQPSGIYLLRITMNGQTETHHLVIL